MLVLDGIEFVAEIEVDPSIKEQQEKLEENMSTGIDITFIDGAKLNYDAISHQLTFTLPFGNITLNVPGGDIIFQTNSFATSLNEIIAIYNAHTHDGVQSGSSDTTPPLELIP